MDGNNASGLEQEDDQLHPQAPLRDQAVGGRHGQVRAGARDVLLDDVQGRVDRRLNRTHTLPDHDRLPHSKTE